MDKGSLVVITGMTGAGRSTAAKELEDLGYFVVDNLPPGVIEEVVRLVDQRDGIKQPIAVVSDIRSGTFFERLRELLAKGLPTRKVTLVFLEATDDVLVRRQEAARRPHPLQGGGRLLDGLAREREVIAALRGDADVVIDTTSLNVHQLKRRVAQTLGALDHVQVRIAVVSFGFKYGIPVDSDLVADMRFLPNPYWEPELKELTGKDQAVSEFVTQRLAAQEFLQRYVDVVDTICAGYLDEGKRFATFAIGCTGGKHRSVAMAEEFGRRLLAQGYDVRIEHRDLGRE
jgi:UPF0042 nucleotide-binding protein